MKERLQKRWRESGNVFFTLFGAIALVGVVGMATSTLMRGPVGTVVNINQRTKADTQMQIASRLAMLEASQMANSGDCDSDGYVEPLPWRAGGAASDPSDQVGSDGGGYLPTQIGSAKLDPWGMDYGYCVWDLGSQVNNAACDNTLGAGPGENIRRLDGGSNPGVPSLVIMSAGPDRVFQTGCQDWADATPTNADTLVNIDPTSDDIIVSFTYNEAVIAGDGMWQLKSGDPGRITTADSQDVEFASGTTAFFENSDANFGMGSMLDLSGGGLFNLPDETQTGGCGGGPTDPDLDMIRITTAHVLELCDGVGWQAIGGAGGSAAVGGNGDIQFASNGFMFADPNFNWNEATDTLAITGTVGITGATNITGNTAVTGTFDVVGVNATNLGGTLDVNGATAISSSLSVGADAFVGGDLLFTSTGTTKISGGVGTMTLNVGGPRMTLTAGGVSIPNALSVTGSSTLTGSATLGNTLSVAGNILDPDSAVTIADTFNVTGASVFDTTVAVAGAVAAASYEVGILGSGEGMFAQGVDGLGLRTNGATALTIDSSGEVGIGTTSPVAQLDVAGAIKVADTVIGCAPAIYGAIKYDSVGDELQICSQTNAWETVGTSGGGGGGTGGKWLDANNIPDIKYTAGDVGIGLNDPLARLHVDTGEVWFTSNSNFLVSGVFVGAAPSVPESGAGTRMFFDPESAAFRAGGVSGTQWDDASIGDYSVAMGDSAVASGQSSIALGADVAAGGTYSMATGRLTTANGEASTAMGREVNVTATGDYSMGIGLTSTSVVTDPTVSAAQSLGIFMGNQNAVDLNTANTMLLAGGKLVIDPDSTSAQFTSASGLLTVDIEGDIGAKQYCDQLGGFCFTAADISGGAISAPGNDGEVLFNSGDLLGTDTIFFYSKAVGRLGIGTNTPGATLDVAGRAIIGGGVGADNVFITGGNDAATGGRNVALGFQAGANIGAGVDNTFIGSDAGTANTGSRNTFIGSTTGNNGAASSDNVLLGVGAGNTFAGANHNVLLGVNAGQRNNAADDNTYVGSGSGKNIDGGQNVIMGRQAGEGALGSSTVVGNVFLGFQAAQGALTGADNNVILGHSTAATLTTGSDNILIGQAIDVPLPGTSDYLNIGDTLFGDLSAGNEKIGTKEYCDETLTTCFTAGDVSGGALGNPGDDREIFFNSNGDLQTNDNFVFTAAGLMGLGTATPTETLYVSGTGHFTGATTIGGTLGVTGNVGIGVVPGASELEVSGVTRSTRFSADNGTAGSPSFSFASNLSTGIFLPGGGEMGLSTNGAERMRVTAAGALVIGDTVATVGPEQTLELDVTGDVGAINYCDEAGDNCFTAASVSSGSGTAPGTDTQIIFNSGNLLYASSGFTFDADGDVVIGNTAKPAWMTGNPASQLFVEGTVQSNGGFIAGDWEHFGWSDDTTYIEGDSVTDYIAFATDTAERMRLTSAGRFGIGTAAPTASLAINHDVTVARDLFRIDENGAPRIKFAYDAGAGYTTAVFNNRHTEFGGGSPDWQNVRVSISPATTGTYGLSIKQQAGQLAVGDLLQIRSSGSSGVDAGDIFVVRGTGLVGIGDPTPDIGAGGQLLLDVEGPAGATKYCDEFGDDCFTAASVSSGGGVAPGVNREMIFNSSGVFGTATGFEFTSAGRMLLADANNSVFLSGGNETSAGAFNVGLGLQALQTNAAGTQSVAVGYQALQDNTAGDDNTALGTYAMLANVAGDGSTGIGLNALRFFNPPAGAAHNVALGFLAMQGNVDGVSSVGVRNTVLGSLSGQTIEDGNDNIIIGYNVTTSGVDADNELNIGGALFGEVLPGLDPRVGSFKYCDENLLNCFTAASIAAGGGGLWNVLGVSDDIYYNSGTPRVGIGTTTPVYAMHNAAGHYTVDLATVANTDQGPSDPKNLGYGFSVAANPLTMGALINAVPSGAWGADIQFNVRNAAGGVFPATPAMTIQSNTSNVGIGTVTPSTLLYVSGGTANGSYLATIENSTDNGEFLTMINDLGAAAFQFNQIVDGSGRQYIYDAAGNIGIDMNGGAGTLRVLGGDGSLQLTDTNGFTDPLDYFTLNPETDTLDFAFFDDSLASTTNIMRFEVDGLVRFQSTGALVMNIGTTGQRPDVPENGMFRYNSDVDRFEAFQGGAWNDIITSGVGGVFIDDLGDAATNYTSGNMFLGNTVGDSVTTGTQNTVVSGANGGTAITTGGGNVIMGATAGDSLTLGSWNVLLGADAGTALNNAGSNVIIGAGAGITLTTQDFNTIVGTQAGEFSTVDNSTFLGYQAGQDTTGVSNTFIGYQAGLENTAGIESTFVGYQAGGAGIMTTGFNTGIGYQAGLNLTDGDDNTLIGWGAGNAMTSGNNNVTIGYRAGNSMTGAASVENIVIGTEAGYNLTTGARNTIISPRDEASPAMTLTTGDRNILLGFQVDTPAAATSDYLNIGNLLTGDMGTGVAYVSSTGAFVTARGTTGQQPGALEDGMFRYNTSTPAFEFRENGAWVGLGGGAGALNIDDLGDAATNYTSGNMFLGQGSGTSVTGTVNTFLGNEAGRDTTSGSDNTFIGYQAGRANTTATANTALGTWAGRDTTIGQNNTYLGYYAGLNNVDGNSSTAVGKYALENFVATGVAANTAVGMDALKGNPDDVSSTGVRNTAMGYFAGQSLESGNDNVFLGYNAGNAMTTGSGTVLIGKDAGLVNTADFSVFIGYLAGDSNIAGTSNTFVGTGAGTDNAGGNNNSYFGSSAGANTTGSGNTFFGAVAGKFSTTGDNNTFMGGGAGLNSAGGANSVYVGSNAGADATGNNNTFLGRGAGYGPLGVGATTTGTDNILIGHEVIASAVGASNELNIGNLITGDLTAGGVTYISSTGALRVPVGVQGERPGVGAAGMFRYNTTPATNDTVEYFDAESGTWLSLLSSGGAIGAIDDLTDAATNYTSANMFLGENAGVAGTPGLQNVGLGVNALGALDGTCGTLNFCDKNTAIGFDSLAANTTGYMNTALGVEAGLAMLTGNNNVFVGYKAGKDGTTGNQNTFIGVSAGKQNNGANANTYVGMRAGELNAAGGNNVYFGMDTGQNATGSNNTFLGQFAGNAATSGNNNILIGQGVQKSVITAANELNIGDTIFGNLSTGHVGIGGMPGTTADNADLEIVKGAGTWPKIRLTAGSVDLSPLGTSASLGDVGGTNTIGQLRANRGWDDTVTKGGFLVQGFTDKDFNDWKPLNLLGMHGGNTPTAAAVTITGQKTNAGGTNREALSGSEIVLDVENRFDNGIGNILFRIQADGVVTFQSTGALVLNTGTTAQRPSPATGGMFRYNTTPSTNDTVEYYDAEGATWQTLVTAGSGSGGLWTDNTTHISYESVRIIKAGQAIPAGLGGDGGMLWYASARSLVGGSDNTWSDANIGTRSIAFGRWDTYAAGESAAALGMTARAIGDASAALNWQTQAIGKASLATGRFTDAVGEYSTAMGFEVDVIGAHSFGIGLYNVEGVDPIVSGDGSFGLFMGDQHSVDFSSANTMGIFGGPVIIDPAQPATNLVADTALDVIGTLKIADGSETCSAAADGGMLRYNTNTIDFCDGSSWTTLATGSGLWTAGAGDIIYYSTGAAPMVGIGTDTPTGRLHMKRADIDSSYDMIRMEGNGEPQLQIDSSSAFQWSNPSIVTTRSRGSRGSEAVVANGDAAFELLVQGHDGTNNEELAWIQVLVDGAPGNNVMPGRIEFQTQNTGTVYAGNLEDTLPEMVIKSSGNVGIGVNNPATRLDINGTLKLDYDAEACNVVGMEGGIHYDSVGKAFKFCANQATGWETVSLGSGVTDIDGLTDAATNYTSGNMFLGDTSGGTPTGSSATGLANTALGKNAGRILTTGGANTLMGTDAGYSLTIGSENVFIGVSSGSAGADNSFNVAVGTQAGQWLSNGANDNTFIGQSAGQSLGPNSLTGDNNTALGSRAGRNLSTGASNVFVGVDAGNGNTTGIENVAIGVSAGGVAASGTRNVTIGHQAGQLNTNTATDNVIIGHQAGDAALTSISNVFIGKDAGTATTSGGDNIFMGRGSGGSNTVGDSNVYIGSNAGTSADSSWNTIVGNIAGKFTTTGNLNTFYGDSAGEKNTTEDESSYLGAQAGQYMRGGQNTALGAYSLLGGDAVTFANNSGTHNVSLGWSTGSTIQGGSRNILVGRDIEPPTAATNDWLNIGNLIKGDLTAAGILYISNNGGLVVSKGTTAQEPAASVALNGMIRYNSTTGKLRTIEGGAWTDVVGAAGGGAINDLSDAATNYTSSNMFLGTGVGNGTNGGGNTGLGADALSSLSGACDTTGPTWDCLHNSAFGYRAGRDLTLGAFNTLLGYAAGMSLTAGDGNTIIGYRAGELSTASENTYIGNQAGQENLTGAKNTMVGHFAGDASVGEENTFMGYLAGGSLGVGTGVGNSNTFIGHRSGRNFDGAHNNTFLGDYSGFSLSSGDDNVLIGQGAGYNQAGAGVGALTTGSGNILIGRDVLASAPAAANELNIGDLITGDMLTGNIAVNGTAALRVPAGNDTTEKPAPLNGMIRYNSTTTKLQGVQGGAWADLIGAAGSGAINDLSDAATNYTSGNMFMGQGSGNATTSGVGNIGLGVNALASLASVCGAGPECSSNTAIGTNAGTDINTGRLNSVFGDLAGFKITTGSHNTYLGSSAGLRTTGGTDNTAVGYRAGYGVVGGSQNVHVGLDAGHFADGIGNVMIGDDAGQGADGLTNVSDNVLIGNNAAMNILTLADNNTIIGANTAVTLTTGAGNILIGNAVDASGVAASNELNIGNTIYGDLSNDYVGIGRQAAGSTLELYKPTGGYPNLWFTAADVTMPDLSSSTSLSDIAGNNAFGQIRHNNGQANTAVKGGMAIHGFTEAGINDWYPLHMVGTHGGNTPTTAALVLSAQKWDGGTNRVELADGEIALDVENKYDQSSGGNTVLMRVMGSGFVGIDGVTPGTALDVNGAFSQRGMTVAPGLSPTDQGRIYYNSTTNKFQVSENGGAYTDLLGGGGGAINDLSDAATNYTSSNMFLGQGAGANATGTNNTFLGETAGGDMTTGEFNTYVGFEAGKSDLTASRNVFMGYRAGESTGMNGDNVIIGYRAADNAGGTDPLNGTVLIGGTAGLTAPQIDNSVVIGFGAGEFAEVNDSLFLGLWAGRNATGDNNIFLGREAGSLATGGDNNILVGNSVQKSVITASNELNIGNTIYGDLTGKRIGIGAVPAAGVAFDVTGDVQITGRYRDISDMRLKKDIEKLDSEDVVGKLSQIDTYSFRMIDDPNGDLEYGVMAQEVEKIFPHMVHTAEDEMGTKSVSYNGFIAPLIEASKLLKAENEDLRAEMTAMKTEREDIFAALTELKDSNEKLAQDVSGMKAHTGYGVDKASMGWMALLTMILGGSVVFFVMGGLRRRKRGEG